jgi:hypothetical protein
MSFQITVPIGPEQYLVTSATQKAPLGTTGRTVDGRVFKYCKNGATALVIGQFIQARTPGQYEQYSSNCPLTTQQGTNSSFTSTWTQLDIASTWCAWDGSTGATLNFLKDGYLAVRGTTGGQIIEIAGNTTGTTGTTGATMMPVTIFFKQGSKLTANITTANSISVHHNKYDGTIVCPGAAALTNVVVGVPVCAVPASYYFWAQSWGPCVVKSDGLAGIGPGKEMILSPNTSSTGFVSVATSTDVAVMLADMVLGNVGVAMSTPSAADAFMLVDLTVSQ